jgi:hypothetical protein
MSPSADVHGDALDALYRSDHGLPAEPGDAERIEALDRHLSDAHDRAVAAAYADWEAQHAARWTEGDGE